MRHQKSLRKFGRTPAHRRAMFRNLATSLLEHERCETTVEKAKDLRRVVEKLITLAGEDTLHRRRRAYSYLQRKDVVHKLFAEIGPRYRERPVVTPVWLGLGIGLVIVPRWRSLSWLGIAPQRRQPL